MSHEQVFKMAQTIELVTVDMVHIKNKDMTKQSLVEMQRGKVGFWVW